MNPEEREQFADRWLDAALRQYSAVEAPPGLESRILDLPSVGSQARWFVAAFGWAAAAAVVLVALWLGTWATWRHYRMNQAPSGSLSNAVTEAARLGAPSGAPTLPAQPRSIPATRHRRRPLKAAPSESPRQDQFPSPAPLSEDERLIIAYVRNTPREEVLLAIARQDEKTTKELNFNSAPDSTSDKELQ